MSEYVLRTPQLGLRTWSGEDRIPFARINADPRVMEFFPAPLSVAESESLADRIQAHFDEHGYGLFAVDELSAGRFIGFIGFSNATFPADFTPCVEIGWRLDASVWGRGYATAGARACLAYGFETFGFKKVYSFTSVLNKPSIRVMEKIGLTKEGEFDHSRVPAGHRLVRHVLFGKAASAGRE